MEIKVDYIILMLDNYNHLILETILNNDTQHIHSGQLYCDHTPFRKSTNFIAFHRNQCSIPFGNRGDDISLEIRGYLEGESKDDSCKRWFFIVMLVIAHIISIDKNKSR